MCDRLIKYPLITYNDDKRKVLFTYPVKFDNREEFNNIEIINNEIHKSKFGLSKYEYLNKLYKQEKFVSFELLQIPCGSCGSCLKQKSRNWAFRILQECKKFDNNYFITFTYSDENIPKDGNLIHDEISKFNKKLKTDLNRKNIKSDFRFYGVGEYGEHTLRPHYHVIYFNLNLPDLVFRNYDKQGNAIYESKFLENEWNKGIIYIGSVSVSSACYVARYCDKKQSLSFSQKEYLKSIGWVPEFSCMSRRPGIGSDSFDFIFNEFKNGCFHLFTDKNRFSIPKYYLDKIKSSDDVDILKMLDVYDKQNKVKGAIQDSNNLIKLDNNISLKKFYKKRCDVL